MDIGKNIYALRKQHNITQEQLANAVGVSTPAVSKWETGVSMPDITLLAPIARKLNTTIDNLLSFKEDLSRTEIQNIIDELKELARKEGFRQAITKGNYYLRQYPNVDALKLEVAMLPSMMAHTSEDELLQDEEKFQKIMDESTLLLEELTHSKDDMTRMSSVFLLASRYMSQRRLLEAEALLNKIPKQTFDTRHLYPSLYMLQGDELKTLECTQANMLQDVQNLLLDIMGQHRIYLKNNDFNKALKCANDYSLLVSIVGATAMCGSELLLDTYLAKNDLDNALKCYIHYIDEIKAITGNYQGSFYYSYIADKVVIQSSAIEDDVRCSLYKYILMEVKYSELRKSQKVIDALDSLKTLLNIK
jgi:transcriptional regulator with XRE-family HTH domain